MATHEPASEALRASDLPIALYLNQRVTFDLLAALEDGFAHVTTIQESSEAAQATTAEGTARLGISNPFVLLGLSFGAKGQHEHSNQSSEMMTEELVHTPTSLFARLRRELVERDLVKTLNGDTEDVSEVSAGDFIEVQAILRRSPLVVVLTTFLRLIRMLEAFGTSAGQPANPGRARRRGDAGSQGSRSGGSQTQQTMKQIQALLDAVTAEGSEDLIAECGASRFVLTAETAYFVDPTMNDVIDGTFRIFGKITRVVPAGAEEGISLLRKSAMGNLGGVTDQLASAFASLPEVGFTGHKIETEIPAPTLQVIPIAIFA